MSTRCKACNATLTLYSESNYKPDGFEEDLCFICKDHVVVFDNEPMPRNYAHCDVRQGLTIPSKDNYDGFH